MPAEAWYVLRTHPHQEFRSEQNLLAGGIDVFLPRMAAARTARSHGQVQPLFPQYLFAWFDAGARLHDVAFTRGVQTPLRVGDALAAVDDSVIDFLKSRVETEGLIHIGAPVRPGDRVIVEAGPFAALVGVVERCVAGRQRVVVLLTALSSPIRIDVDVQSIRSLSA